MAPRVIQSELLRIRGKRTEDLTIYEKSLLVREHLNALDVESLREAERLLSEILAEQPHWGEAYALAADWHALMVAEGWSGTREFNLREMDRYSRIALDLDSDNLRALVHYGHRRSLFYRDYEIAQSYLQRGLDVGPGWAWGWLWSSYTQAYLGNGADALRMAERAFQLSPRDKEAHWFYSAMCLSHYTNGSYDEAADWGLRAVSEPVVWRGGPFWAAAALAGAGRTREAQDVVSVAVSKWPGRTVADAVASHPYRDPRRRERYGQHLVEAGVPQ